MQDNFVYMQVKDLLIEPDFIWVKSLTLARIWLIDARCIIILQHRLIYIDMRFIDVNKQVKYVKYFYINILHVNIVNSHVDINKSHVDTNNSHVGIIISHVFKVMLQHASMMSESGIR